MDWDIDRNLPSDWLLVSHLYPALSALLSALVSPLSFGLSGLAVSLTPRVSQSSRPIPIPILSYWFAVFLLPIGSVSRSGTQHLLGVYTSLTTRRSD